MTHEKIKAALEFYANRENYKSRFVTEECGCCSYEHDPVMDDGERAREALALLEAQTSAGEEIGEVHKAIDNLSWYLEDKLDSLSDDVLQTVLEAARRYAASQQTRGEVHDRRDQVCEEICRIMKEYDRQISVRGYVDTPGGLEDMGDVWNLLRSWQYLLTPPVAGKDRGE